MNILDVLKEEHKAMRKSFDQLEQALDSENEPVRGMMYEALSLELLLHNEIEQEVFYNHLEGGREAQDAVQRATEEHESVAALIDELDEDGPDALDDDAWRERLTELRALAADHIEEEESVVHALAEQELSEEQLEAIGNEYTRFKVTIKEQMLAGIERERDGGAFEDDELDEDEDEAPAKAPRAGALSRSHQVEEAVLEAEKDESSGI